MENLTWLERRYPEAKSEMALADDAHPMRKVTREVAYSKSGWSRGRRDKVRELFDSMAQEWRTKSSEGRLLALRDALERGGLERKARCFEVGCGSGNVTSLLMDYFDQTVCLDLSFNMISLVSQDVDRFLADASNLPIKDASVDVLVVLNMFLFPEEYSRVLKAGGSILWASSDGDRTPIYLPPVEVAKALGDEFSCLGADAGQGCWLVGTKMATFD
ncbi:MAG: methyltransferase domain-containing protein [Acidimicrobiaceae bacterium]|nr:methyltransferase domain-containing protein [Acidimicrobiaceae bacterium]